MSPAGEAPDGQPLRIGVDALNILHDRRGIGRYVRALIGAWSTVAGLEIIMLLPHFMPSFVAGRLARELGLRRVRAARRSQTRTLGLDVAWHPWNGIFFASGTRDVATIHDVWPFVDAPADDPRLAASRQEPFLVAAERAARIITDSQFSKSEIVRHLGVNQDRIAVVPLGVEAELLRARPQPAHLEGFERYFLFVGETEGRKDLTTALRAVALLPDDARLSTAVIVAGRLAASASIPAGVHVEFAGHVDDERLHSLYAGATALIFPSRYEGFGLPVVEAMALGTPVVASDMAAIAETGGDAALYFTAGNAQACAAALERIIGEPPLVEHLRAMGRARAAEMTWDRCAAATLDVLRSAAAGGSFQ